MMQLLWHYTTRQRAPHILRAGALLSSEAIGDDPLVPRLRMSKFVEPSPLYTTAVNRGVWFSNNSLWERTAARIGMGRDGRPESLGTMDLMHQYVGIVRIGVDPAKVPLMDWDTFVRESGMTELQATGFVMRGRERGARPEEWFATFESVPLALWEAFEEWNGKRWEPMVVFALERDLTGELNRVRIDLKELLRRIEVSGPPDFV